MQQSTGVEHLCDVDVCLLVIYMTCGLCSNLQVSMSIVVDVVMMNAGTVMSTV